MPSENTTSSAFSLVEVDRAVLAGARPARAVAGMENYHRLIAAECHMRHIKFREETRYPGYYYRTDFPEIDNNNWKVFVNSRYDRDTGDWSFRKIPYEQLIKG